MIPILYEKNETFFTSNGLGRLRDCISCIVTEERNGIYEVDFEYPVDGHNFDQIIPGRIIGVTHDDSSDIQPFDIVSHNKTINGTVTFHGVHISYRLLKVVANGSNINTLADAITMLNNGTPTNPFTIETDFESSAYFAAADGVPKSVRQFLGGIEGSVLDSYGGELLFDKFNVKLLRSRGEYKPVTVRYGLNLTDYNEDTDYLGAYTSVIPYWQGTNANGVDTVLIGDIVDSGLTSYNGRNECIPLDLTDKFEEIPTKANLESYALNQIINESVNLPNRSIEVKYIDLKDFGEYETIANLIQCKLCDTINVVFPRFNMNARFKIVKTEYNVLQDRFESVELGKLSTTLAEALGVGSDGLNKEANTMPMDITETRITTFSSGWAQYADGGTNEMWVRKYGRIVELTGVLKNTSARTLNATGVKVFTIPSGYRPIQGILSIHQGTDTGVWLSEINTAGEVYVSRYRKSNSASYPSVSSGSWFPFHITYISAN